MNLIIKTAVGIYIISVLVFSSFSKANDFESTFAGSDIYNLATTPESVVGIIEELKDSIRTYTVDGLAGELSTDGESVFFVSQNQKTYFRLSPEVLNQIDINTLPLSVSISGFYNSDAATSFSKRNNFLFVEDLQILN